MGKAARASNKDRRERRSARELTNLTLMVSNLFGRRPQCMEAVALFAATAHRLGAPVEVRAVSVLAVDTHRLAVAATGSAAAAEAQQRLGMTIMNPPTDTSPDSFERAGHMVVTSDQLSMVFDPSFRQFSLSGIPDVVVAGTVRDTHPREKQILLRLDGGRIEVNYFLDDENTGWQEDLGHVIPAWSDAAGSLATHVRNGGTAAKLPFEIPWDEHPLG